MRRALSSGQLLSGVAWVRPGGLAHQSEDRPPGGYRDACLEESGFFIIVFLVGLKNIPNDVKEAAAIDGASQWAQVLRVELPS